MLQFSEIEEAIAPPETAGLLQLWQDVEHRLGILIWNEKLGAVGEAIAQLAALCFA